MHPDDSASFRHIALGCVLSTMLIGCGTEQEARRPNPYFPDSLVGSWVRVYPSPAGVDTVVVEPAGVARGPKSAVSADHIERITRWEISWLDPLSLCFGQGEHVVCSGYQLRGDTLALANADQTVLIRAEALWLDAALLDSTEPGVRSRWGDSAQILRVPGRR
jgi:hypothetical protein